MYLDNVEVHENAKKSEMGKYSAILSSCLVNDIGGFHCQVIRKLKSKPFNALTEALQII